MVSSQRLSARVLTQTTRTITDQFDSLDLGSTLAEKLSYALVTTAEGGGVALAAMAPTTDEEGREVATVRDLWGLLGSEELNHEAKLIVEVPDGQGGLQEVPVRSIHWSKTSWGDDKLLFDTTD